MIPFLKVTALWVLICSVNLPSIAEDRFVPSPIPSPLQEEFDLIGLQWSDKTSWSVTIECRSPEYPVKRNTDAIDATSAWAASIQEMDGCKGYLAEHALTKKYEKNIVSFLSDLSMIGNDYAYFLNADTVSLPVRFARKDTVKTALLTGLATETVFNTLRTTARSRASKVIQSFVLPAMKPFAQNFRNTEFDRIGICAIYGSKDFGNDASVLNLYPEVVVLVSPIELVNEFISGKMSEDKMISASDIFLSDRDMSFDFKKIEIDLE